MDDVNTKAWTLQAEGTRMDTRTWQDNAEEFAALDQGEGWPFARLVACSVEKGANNGRPSKTSAIEEVSGKVSAEEFARRADTSGDRVLRYLNLWQKAAEKGWVPSADTLTPEDAVKLTDPEHSWKELYDARKAGGRPRDSKVEDAVTIIERRGIEAVTAAMTPEMQVALVEHLITDPEVAASVVHDYGFQQAVERATEDNTTYTFVKEPISSEELDEYGKKIHRHHKEQEAAEAELVYDLRGFKVLPVLWEAENLVEFVETRVAQTDENKKYAMNAGNWMGVLSKRLLAWANGETRPLSEDDFAEEIEKLLKEVDSEG